MPRRQQSDYSRAMPPVLGLYLSDLLGQRPHQGQSRSQTNEGLLGQSAFTMTNSAKLGFFVQLIIVPLCELRSAKRYRMDPGSSRAGRHRESAMVPPAKRRRLPAHAAVVNIKVEKCRHRFGWSNSAYHDVGIANPDRGRPISAEVSRRAECLFEKLDLEGRLKNHEPGRYTMPTFGD
jgi:hypothetical protein